jgi:hypothetical protein
MVLAGQITRGQRLEILGREREGGGWWLVVGGVDGIGCALCMR